jgi:hypothetical protein
VRGWARRGRHRELGIKGPAYNGSQPVYGPTLTFSTGRAYDLLEGVAVGDRLHVSYTRGRKGTLTAAAVT